MVVLHEYDDVVYEYKQQKFVFYLVAMDGKR